MNVGNLFPQALYRQALRLMSVVLPVPDAFRSFLQFPGMQGMRFGTQRSNKFPAGIGMAASVWLLFFVGGFSSSAQTADSASHEGAPKARLTVVAGTGVLGFTAGLLYLSEIWYADSQRVPFQFYRDHTGWLQMDKFAHSYVAYQQSYWGYEALRWAGVSRSKALWIGGSLGFVLQLPIELFDGMYEGYGFSWSDVAANTVGSAIFIGQEMAWGEQRMLPKFSFYPSPYASLRPGTLGRTLGAQLVQDYNAQTYWFSFSPGSFFDWDNWPPWLCLSIGYSGEGMLGEFENPDFINGESVKHIYRYRQYFISLDMDLRKIKTRHGFLKGLFHAMNMIKIPAPAMEFNTKNGLRFRPVYY
ncbi:DUF2279 domain-containing protein [Cyclobacterium xiamenense]|uniref:DUF2279 domain-containing protein n=1 Tax=Cyclobacterium xiamenense TaxID=1297121 RepID=UPI0012B9F6D6|nr:DUF2279 domain-containing protein [Cyclobacterium xiamenense]